MMRRIKAAYKDEFFRHNAVFFVGSMLVAVLNYLYHPIVSRMLTVEQFGEVQAYLSIAMQFTVVAGVFGMVVLNIKANHDEAKKSESTEQNSLIAQLYTLSMGLMVVISALLLAASPYLTHGLALSTSSGLFIVVGILLLSTSQTFANFHLQAEKFFAKVSISGIIASLGKIVFSVLFIYLGFSVAGALAGYLVATFVALAYIYPKTKSTISPSQFTWVHFTPELWRELRFGVLVLFATGFATFLYTADIIVVRYFFTEETAGLYAGIATVARIIVFATASVAGVAIAHVKLRQSREENHALMRKSLVIVTLIGGCGLTLFTLFPELIMSMLMGSRFLSLAPLLPLLTLLMFAVSITNLFVMYFLALRKFVLIPVVSISGICIAIFTFLWHSAVTHVIWDFLCGIAIALLILIVLYVR